MIPTLEQSRDLLLSSLEGDVTLCKLQGNMGDHLIDAGAEALLQDIPHRTVWRADLGDYKGDTLIINGSGGWCRYWHDAISETLELAGGFRRVVVFPSTFEVDDPLVLKMLPVPDVVFARERVSYYQTALAARSDVWLAHDPAFFFDFEPYRREGRGILRTFRTDVEQGGGQIPDGSQDISATCSSLHDWLNIIADSAEIHTDRAHVMIAGALLGKKVRYRSCVYFKVDALADTWLGEYDVKPL